MPGRPRRTIKITADFMREQVQLRIDSLQTEIDSLQDEVAELQEQLKKLNKVEVTFDVPVWQNKSREKPRKSRTW